MAQVSLQSGVPASILDVLGPVELAGIALGGVGLALVAAWLPAQRTARSSIAPVLQAE